MSVILKPSANSQADAASVIKGISAASRALVAARFAP